MYYNITFKYSDTTYCSNIAIGSETQLKKHYADYEIVSISEASEYDLQDAQRKGKPVIDCTAETTETTEETTQEEKNMDKNTLYDLIRDYFTGLDDAAIVQIWNEYCRNNNLFDDEILDYDYLEELIENSNEGGMYWINRFYFGSDDYSQEGSANPNRNYFKFNGYGNILSFDYIYNSYTDKFNYIEIGDLIDYIIENNDPLCDDGIEEILNNAAADDETIEA